MGRGEADAGWELGWRWWWGGGARAEESQPARNKEGGGSADCARKRPLRSALSTGAPRGGNGSHGSFLPLPSLWGLLGLGDPLVQGPKVLPTRFWQGPPSSTFAGP